MIENVVARIIMENRDNGGCIVKDWEAEERDNPHVAQALRQSRAVIAAIAALIILLRNNLDTIIAALEAQEAGK